MSSSDQRQLLGWALRAGAFLMIVVGALLFFLVDEVVGIVVGAIGILDLLTLGFVLRAVDRGRAKSGGAPDRAAAADPSYNPYARED